MPTEWNIYVSAYSLKKDPLELVQLQQEIQFQTILHSPASADEMQETDSLPVESHGNKLCKL